MLVVRGTKKLRDRVKGPLAASADTSTTELGDWFATALFWKPQVALLVNARTFLPVIAPLAPAASLLDRVPAAIESILRRHGVDELAVLADPSHPDHTERLQWLGGPFDPERFDPSEFETNMANDVLARLDFDIDD